MTYIVNLQFRLEVKDNKHIPNPVDVSKLVVSVGLNCFWNIGVESLWRTKLVLLDLDPFNASYCAINKDSETVPYCKLGGVFNKSSSV